MESQQQLELFGMGRLLSHIAQLQPDYLRRLFRGLLFEMVKNPRCVTACEADGSVLMEVSVPQVAKHAGVSTRSIQRYSRRLEAENLITQDQPVNDPAVWSFNLKSVLPASAVSWFVEVVETGDPWHDGKSEKRPLSPHLSPRQRGDCHPTCHPDSGVTVTPTVTPTDGVTEPILSSCHEHDHEIHERMNERTTRKFSNIDRLDVLTIGGYGGRGLDPVAVFREYEADAIRYGLADRGQSVEILGLFLDVARRHRLPRNADGRVNTPGSYIRTCWQRYRDGDEIGLQVPDEDLRRAAAMLRAHAAPVTAPPPVEPPTKGDRPDVTAVEMRIAELRSLTTDQRRDVAAAIDNAFLSRRLLRNREWTPQMFEDAARATLNPASRPASAVASKEPAHA